MYSRNSYEKREYSVPPGYDGSRFRRRRRHGDDDSRDEIILVPDSGFAPDSTSSADLSGELSVSGIPTKRGSVKNRQSYTPDENTSAPVEYSSAEECHEEEAPSRPKDKLTGILEKFGFTGGMSSDELLICAVIFLIASDVSDDGRSVGDVLLILALLLGIR